jgi:hypothetical protein
MMPVRLVTATKLTDSMSPPADNHHGDTDSDVLARIERAIRNLDFTVEQDQERREAALGEMAAAVEGLSERIERVEAALAQAGAAPAAADDAGDAEAREQRALRRQLGALRDAVDEVRTLKGGTKEKGGQGQAG